VVGESGHVFTFEFSPDNLEILQRNRALNPSLATWITVIEEALWDRSGEILRFPPDGPGTTFERPDGEPRNLFSVTTVALDDFVEAPGPGRVDFIKLDVEGAKLRTLRGAERTLARFRPTLAISVYHREDDLVTIRQYLASLDLGYRFSLDHFTIHQEEAVLFAVVSAPSCALLTRADRLIE
jgi:FkbM family methyltransferase